MQLEKKQAEILQIEESYGTLQEELAGINKKLKKVMSLINFYQIFHQKIPINFLLREMIFNQQVFNCLCSAKSELSDTQSEYSKLREGILDNIRASNKEIKLANLTIGHFIPGEH